MEFVESKRARSQNWDEVEKHSFLEAIREELHIIENKKKLTVLNKDKTAAWERISRKMEVQGFIRDVKRMREQWQRMKVVAKKNVSTYRKHAHGTGGGPPAAEPADIDWKIKDLLPHEFVEDASMYDSDALPVREETSHAPSKVEELKTMSLVKPCISSPPSTPSTSKLSCSFINLQSSSFQEKEMVDRASIDDNEEIHIIVQSDEEQALENGMNTPKQGKRAVKKMTEYEEQLLLLNKKRMALIMEKTAELYDLKIRNEQEYHEERMRLLRERMCE